MNNKLLTTALLSLLGLPAIASDVKTITQGGAAVAQGDFTLFLTNPAHLATYGEEYLEEAKAEAEEAAEDAVQNAATSDPALATADTAVTETPATDTPEITPEVQMAEPVAPVDEAAVKPWGGFGMALDFSAYVQDEKDMIGNVEDVVDLIDELESNAWDEVTRNNAYDKLNEINGGRISAKANASAYIAVPNKAIPLGIFINNNVNVAGMIEATDVLDVINTLNNGEDLGDILDDLSDLGELDNAYAAVSGIWTMDVGVTAAHEFNFKETSKLKIGAAFKYQHVTLYDYTARIDDFDEDDIKDIDSQASGANIDLGVAYTFNDWLSVGFTAENLISKKYYAARNKTTGVRNCYEIEPQYTIGAGLKYGIVSLLADVELVKNPGMNVIQESQYANVGVKFDFWRQASLSVGYQIDMTSNEENMICVGLGISPGDVVSLDIVGMLGDNSYGGGIRIGLKF